MRADADFFRLPAERLHGEANEVKYTLHSFLRLCIFVPPNPVFLYIYCLLSLLHWDEEYFFLQKRNNSVSITIYSAIAFLHFSPSLNVIYQLRFNQFVARRTTNLMWISCYQVKEQLKRDRWMGKINFVEIRTFWHIFRSFDRMWSFFILSLQVNFSRWVCNIFTYSPWSSHLGKFPPPQQYLF